MRILYSTRIRVGAPTGPGVNEASFVAVLRRLEDGGEHTSQTVVTPYAAPPPSLPRPLQLVVGGIALVFGEVRHLVRIRRAMRRFRPDVHVSRLGPFPVATLLSSRLWVPFAAKTLSIAPDHAFGTMPVISLVATRLNRSISRAVIRRSVAVDCVTAQILGQIEELHPQINGYIVDNGVDTELFRPRASPQVREQLGIPADVDVIAYLGGQPASRGGAEVVESVARVASEPPVWGLVVGCSTADVEALQTLASTLGVDDRVRLLPPCPPDDVPELMSVASIGVSLDDPDRAAYYGNASQKVRQYLACGLAVVAFEGTNRFITDEQVGVQVETSAAVPDAVASLLRSDELRSGRLGARARSFAERELSQAERLDLRLAIWADAVDSGTPG